MNRKKWLKILRIIISWSFVGVVLVPFGLVVINSLKTTQEAARMNMKWPETFHFENYLEVIEEGHMVRSFFNSLFIALFCVIIGITASAMAAYVISRYKSKLNRFCFYFFFVGLIAPVNYVTTIRVMKWLRLINSYRGMIISVYNFWGLYTSEWNLICAVIVLTLAPIMIVYILAQKYIIAGMTAGSVKG